MGGQSPTTTTSQGIKKEVLEEANKTRDQLNKKRANISNNSNSSRTNSINNSSPESPESPESLESPGNQRSQEVVLTRTKRNSVAIQMVNKFLLAI